jgi:hypothetical protein
MIYRIASQLGGTGGPPVFRNFNTRAGRPCRGFRRGNSLIPVIIYLAAFVVLLILVSNYYLLPALKASQTPDPEGRKILSAHAAMVMALLLVVLLLGLLMAFRIGRFFRPRPSTPRKPTVYVDAWKESGKRMQVPKDEGE